MTKKIGILGGTFDPPHFGHLLIASEILHKMQLSEVWFIPNQIPPHKSEKHFSDSRHRLNMLKLAIKDNDHFKINTLELEREGPSYTYDTIHILREQYPDYSFHFIIGADMIEYLPHWHKIDEIIKIVSFIGVKRHGYKTVTDYPVNEIEIPMFDVSSTMLRERLNKNESTAYLLPEDVKRYIKGNHLYGTR
ncbi:nicotinate-nucleotide adenylyltransferase [Metabacillus crassostreae]|uniref:nicotinate-nucleotide adenylyltransferase n=1 Tax=Metabacillus crassostreae TaxID=929098 RepID=UPI001957472D|nr:nicotinate-nucleotide adenylyltransferase [Metabacillus crassostreae]MBM7604773.1 nicotinate-nucleotide adenylyltransferase [Metabacillus crassostreae]